VAVRMLVFGHMANVQRRVRMRVPAERVDEVAGAAVVSAVASAVSYEGESVGQFVNWLNRIVDRRIADFHRRKRLDETPLVEEHEGEEGIWGEVPLVSDATGLVEVRMVIERLLEKLNDVHRRVVELYVFERWEAREAAERVNRELPDLDPPMSVDNVHQIAKRFRDDLRDHLGAGFGEDGGG
jgi:RNA polymerase sigma factor (sigma-70 family)